MNRLVAALFCLFLVCFIVNVAWASAQASTEQKSSKSSFLGLFDSVFTEPTKEPSKKDDENFFHPSPNSLGPKNYPLVNPKKVTIPLDVGTSITFLKWNQTESNYFGGFRQIVSRDVHYYWINSTAIASEMDEASHSNTLFLQLRQQPNDDFYINIHVERRYSNNPSKKEATDVLETNTNKKAAVKISLPPVKTKCQWLVRVQPNQHLGLWSKPLEYSIVLFERELHAGTVVRGWTSIIIALLVVLISASCVGYWFLLKPQPSPVHVDMIDSQAPKFLNLNSAQHLLPLSEARQKATQGQLEQKDTVYAVKKSTSATTDISKVVDEIIKRNSPSPASLESIHSKSNPPAIPPKPTNIQTSQKVLAESSNKTIAQKRDSPASEAQEASSSSSSAAAPNQKAQNGPKNTTMDPKSQLPGLENQNAPVRSASVVASPSKTGAQPAFRRHVPGTSSPQKAPPSNVKKMAEFWANGANK